jgi:hypothetical protein
MRKPIPKTALLLALTVLSHAAAAQDQGRVDRQIDDAIAAHQREDGGGPLAFLLHGRDDPLRRHFRRLALLAGPFRFGGSAAADSATIVGPPRPIPDGPNPGGR